MFSAQVSMSTVLRSKRLGGSCALKKAAKDTKSVFSKSQKDGGEEFIEECSSISKEINE